MSATARAWLAGCIACDVLGLGFFAILVTLILRATLAGWAQQRRQPGLFPVQRRLSVRGE